jgi:hypothetical protein
MLRDRIQLKPLEVLGVYPRDEVPDYLIIHIRTERGQGLDDRLM